VIDALEDLSADYRSGPWLFVTGMFDVYAGTDTKLGRPVHLRFLMPRYARVPEAVASVVAQAKSAAAVDPPNVVYDIGMIGGRLCVVTSETDDVLEALGDGPALTTGGTIPVRPQVREEDRSVRRGPPAPAAALVRFVAALAVVVVSVTALLVVAWNDTDPPTPGRAPAGITSDLPAEIPR
jgi:hypothetical protein